MINYIIGRVAHKGDGYVVLENNGIGYEINVSNNALVNLVQGEEAKLLTYLQVKEDGISLFGFESNEEKEMFFNLISVSGVGAKMAIMILSSIRLTDLGVAIATSDIHTLTKIKGLGKKTAERIVVELKDKINAFGLIANSNEEWPTPEIGGDDFNDAVEVLVGLGLNKTDVIRSIKRVAKSGDKREDIVAKVLKGL